MRERVDDRQRPGLHLERQRLAQPAALHLLRQRERVVARLRREHDAALAPERVAQIAHPRAAGALLLPQLLAAARHRGAVLGRVRAAPLAACSCTTASQMRSVFTRWPNSSSLQVDRPDLLVLHVHDINGHNTGSRLTTPGSHQRARSAKRPSSYFLPFFFGSSCGCRFGLAAIAFRTTT